ncbi:proton-conducting transporter membrane subunit [Halobacteriaceae archaeon GCM10025711]
MVARAAFALLVVGFGVKAALMPLHGWLPSAMVAPTPVSGLLHAVAVVKSGVFGLARVVLFVFGPEAVRDLGVALPLALVAAATMLLAGALALRQDNLKRGVAYSTVSQLSYIVLGLAVLTPRAAFGAVFHVVAHAVMKLTVFLCVGALAVEADVKYVSQVPGVGRRMPVTMAAFGVAAAGLVGLPLVAGFVSKWYLALGSLAGAWPVLAAAFWAAGLLKLLYFWPIVGAAFVPGWADRFPAGPLYATASDARTDGGPQGRLRPVRDVLAPPRPHPGRGRPGRPARGATRAAPLLRPGADRRDGGVRLMVALAAVVPPWTLVFAAAVVVALVPRRVGFAVAVAATALVVPWSLALPSGPLLATTLYGFDVVPFAADDLTRLLGVTFGFIATVDLVYAAGSGASRRQAAFVLAYVGASLGAVFAGDWLTLVVWWELMAVTATLLVWDAGGDAARAGFRYAVYHEVGGVFLAAGVLLQFLRTGTFVFGDGIAGGLPAALAAVGIGLNVGFLGLHVWLVDSYPRPNVATSVVLAGFTTKVGVYALVRAFPGGSRPVAAVGGAMLLFGVTMAILQTDLRRLLTYHIVSQVGYMVAGVAVASPLAAAGGLAHLLNNVLYKSLLFMVAGVLVLRTREERLQRLGGLRREMPLTFLAFAVAALSIAGTPGFNGFVSKGMIFDGVEAAGRPVLWWVLLLGGVGTVVSFAKVGYYAFFHGPADRSVADASPLQAAAMFAIAGVCVLFGVAPDLLFALLPAAGRPPPTLSPRRSSPKRAASWSPAWSRSPSSVDRSRASPPSLTSTRSTTRWGHAPFADWSGSSPAPPTHSTTARRRSSGPSPGWLPTREPPGSASSTPCSVPTSGPTERPASSGRASCS